MKKDVIGQSIGVQMISAADGSAFTDAVSVSITGDNGTQTAGAGTAPVHEGNGYHSYSPTQPETNFDHIAFTFTGTGAIPATVQVYTTFPQSADNEVRLATIEADTNELQTNQGNWLTATGFNTQTPLDAAGVRSALGLAAANLDTQLGDIPTVSELNARTLLAADYFDPATDTVANVTTVGTVTGGATAANQTTIINDLTSIKGTGFSTSTDSLEAIRDRGDTAWVTGGASGLGGTADSGTTTTVVDAERTEADTDYWKGSWIKFTSGTLNGQTRLITGFDPATDTITFAPATTVAVTTHTYDLLPAANIDLVNTVTTNTDMRGTDNAALATVCTEARLAELDAANLPADVAAIPTVDHTTALTTIDTVVDGIQADLDNATDGLGAIKTAVDAIPTTSAPSAAVNAAAVWDALQASHTTPGSFGEIASEIAGIQTDLDNGTDGLGAIKSAVDAISSPSAATIADAVWNELQSEHVTAGTFGELASEIATILTNTNLLGTPEGASFAADIANLPTVAELNARTLASADYFDPATDTVANVTTCATNTDMLTAAAVNAEMVDVLKTDTMAERAQGAPPATPTMEDAVMYIYMALRNKIDVTSTTKEFHNDAGTVIWKKALSDDGTTYSEAEGVTGP